MNKKIASLIVGPTDKTKIIRFGNIKPECYQKFIDSIGLCLAKNLDRIDLIPDDGIPLDIARAYKRYGGNQVVGYIPNSDYDNLQSYFGFCDRIEEFGAGWSTLNTCLSLKSDIIISVGMSPGTIVELAYTKYHKKYLNKSIPLLIDLRSIEGRLPRALEDELDIRYFKNNKRLKELLEGFRKDGTI